MEWPGAFLPVGIEVPVALLLLVASAFTSALTASLGVGGGVAMLALMGLFVPVASLIPVHGAVQLGSNSGRAWHLRAHVRLDVAWPFIAGSVLGAVAGALVVVQLPDALLEVVLGIFVILLVWVKFPGIERVSRPALAGASVVLAFAGMLVGATGPLVSVLFARFFDDDKKGLVATHAVGMTAQHSLKVLAFAFAGFAFADWLPLIAAMAFSGYLGTVYGSRLLDGMPEARFRKWFRIALTLLALQLVYQGARAHLF